MIYIRHGLVADHLVVRATKKNTQAHTVTFWLAGFCCVLIRRIMIIAVGHVCVTRPIGAGDLVKKLLVFLRNTDCFRWLVSMIFLWNTMNILDLRGQNCC